MSSNGKGSGPKYMFQGKYIQRIGDCFFWYNWGTMEFDIREIRAYFNQQEELKRDWSTWLCSVFQGNMRQIESIVGDENFKDILTKINDNRNTEPF